MGILQQFGGMHGITRVKVTRTNDEGASEEFEAEGLIQSDSAFFEVDTPIYEGDVIEVPDPRKGADARVPKSVAKVKVNNFGPPDMQHLKVTWGTPPTPRKTPKVRRLTFEGLHHRVADAAGNLFSDGYLESAVLEAFKSIEVRIREMSGLEGSGARLMGDAFAPKAPLIDVAVHSGQSGADEREGFLALFRGAMQGIRNPKAHELFSEGDPEQALEYLGLASLLHRRLDSASVRKSH